MDLPTCLRKKGEEGVMNLCQIVTSKEVMNDIRKGGVLVDEIPTGVELNRKFKAQIVLKEGAQPVQKKPYPLPLSLEEPLKETITYLLERGIIQPSSSEFASPIIFTKKADGSLRFCTDLHTTDFRAGRKNWSDDSARTTRELECAECTIIYLKYGLSSLVLATRSES